VTSSPSDNIAFANYLASTSFGNALVCLEDGARDDVGRHWLGASVETYQWLLIKRINIPENGNTGDVPRWRDRRLKRLLKTSL
jgi:hypothetical protein